METIREQAWPLVIIICLTALAVLLLRLWLRRRRRESVERDASGLWRYHRETQIRYRRAVGPTLAEADQKKKAASPQPEKQSARAEKGEKAIAVIHFHGDLRAKQHNMLARLVDELEINKERFSEVIVCIHSAGGGVPQYGHAYAEMARIRELGMTLTVCVDVIAASGGYLMSLPAHRIVAAPFALIGSIGVMAFVPNVRELLLDHKIKPRTFTAGELKRTVTLTDEATPEEVAHFKQQLETIHRLFREALAKYRPAVDLEKAASGDHWTAQESVELGLGLVDVLGTSHSYILGKNFTHDVAYYSQKRNVWDDGVGRFFSVFLDRLEDRIFSWQVLRVGV